MRMNVTLKAVAMAVLTLIAVDGRGGIAGTDLEKFKPSRQNERPENREDRSNSSSSTAVPASRKPARSYVDPAEAEGGRLFRLADEKLDEGDKEYDRKDYRAAETAYLEALDYDRKSFDAYPSPDHKHDIAFMMERLAWVSWKLNTNQLAIDYVNQAIAMSDGDQDYYGDSSVLYRNIGLEEYAAGNCHRAQQCFKMALTNLLACDGSDKRVKKALKQCRDDIQMADIEILAQELGMFKSFEDDPVKVAKGLLADQKYKAGDGETHCNEFVKDFVRAAVGRKVPELENGSANEQAEHLGRSDHWKKLSSESLAAVFDVAQKAANKGGVVVVAWQNPDPGGHGHIAMIVKGKLDDSGDWGMKVPTIAQAGRHNFCSKKLSAGFKREMKESIQVFVLTKIE